MFAQKQNPMNIVTQH